MRLMMGFLYLIAWSSWAEKASVIYLDYFGDYLIYEPYKMDIDPAVDSLATIKARIEVSLGNKVTASLALIGFGHQDVPENIVLASHNTDCDVPLKYILTENQIRDSLWRIYFVDRSLAYIVTDKKPHHPSSPFAFLAAAGMRDLIWF